MFDRDGERGGGEPGDGLAHMAEHPLPDLRAVDMAPMNQRKGGVYLSPYEQNALRRVLEKTLRADIRSLSLDPADRDTMILLLERFREVPR